MKIKLDKFIILSKTNLKESIKWFAQTNRKTTIMFMNSENNKASDAHRLRLNLTDKMDLRRGDMTIALSELSLQFLNHLAIVSKKQ